MNKSIMNKSITHEFTTTVEVPASWIKFITDSIDIFKLTYCGAWMKYIESSIDDSAMLIFDCYDHIFPSEDKLDLIVKSFLYNIQVEIDIGKPVYYYECFDFYKLDTALALKAYEQGCKRWGVDWYSKADGPMMNIAIQLALFGEIKYV